MTRAEAERDRPVVLICEDDAALRGFLRVALGADFDYAETGDGSKALELTRRLRPDVVLLDVMLPGETGLEVVRRIREDPELRDTPVAVMTAYTDLSPEEVEAAGADRFLSKPFDAAELLAAVRELVARGR